MDRVRNRAFAMFTDSDAAKGEIGNGDTAIRQAKREVCAGDPRDTLVTA